MAWLASTRFRRTLVGLKLERDRGEQPRPERFRWTLAGLNRAVIIIELELMAIGVQVAFVGLNPAYYLPGFVRMLILLGSSHIEKSIIRSRLIRRTRKPGSLPVRLFLTHPEVPVVQSRPAEPRSPAARPPTLPTPARRVPRAQVPARPGEHRPRSPRLSSTGGGQHRARGRSRRPRPARLPGDTRHYEPVRVRVPGSCRHLGVYRPAALGPAVGAVRASVAAVDGAAVRALQWVALPRVGCVGLAGAKGALSAVVFGAVGTEARPAGGPATAVASSLSGGCARGHASWVGRGLRCWRTGAILPRISPTSPASVNTLYSASIIKPFHWWNLVSVNEYQTRATHA